MELQTRSVSASACGIERIRVLLCRSHALGNQRRITADKVHAHLLCCLIQSFRNRHKILRCFAGAAAYQRNRGNRNSLVYNRNAKVSGNLLSGRYQILCISGDLFINFFIQGLQIVIDSSPED